MKRKILFIVLMLLVCVTGCGSSGTGSNSSNGIISTLNSVIDSELETWEENQYGATMSVVGIQNSLDEDTSLVIIASGDVEFTNSTTDTTYNEFISDYDGTSYSNTRMLEEDLEVNHMLIYDTSSGSYYDVTVTYKEFEFESGAGKEYPYFSDAIKIS